MDINERFLQIEKKYNLYFDEIDGNNYWVYSRFEIWSYILSIYDGNIGVAHNQPRRIRYKLKSCFEIIGTILFGKKVHNKNVEVLILNHERKIKVGNQYECKYTEKIRDLLEHYYVLERPYEMRHLKPTNTKNLIYLDKIAVVGNLYYFRIRKFHKKRYKVLLREVKDRTEIPLKELKQNLQLDLDLDHIYAIITKRLLISKRKHIEYEKIFRKIHPKLIIEVVSYNMDCMIVNEIAKREGIRTVELQHGNLFPMHIPYQYAADQIVRQLPDEIWLLSDYWKKQLQLPIDEEYLIPVGFPYFEAKIKEIREKYQRRSNRKTILFISQGTVGGQLSEFAVKFAHLCKRNEYRILYKLHPGEIPDWKERYIELKECEEIEVIDRSEPDLYQLFVESDVQVGVYSTALFEGIGFGLLTYICNVDTYTSQMQPLIEQGYAKRVDTPADLKLAVQNEQTEGIQKEFWLTDSLNVIEAQINRIIKGNKHRKHL